MAMVFVLWHVRTFARSHVRTFDDGDAEAEKLIGVYSTEELVAEARERIVALPGFREDPGGFKVHPYDLDHDAWTEGFLTFPAWG